MTLSEQGQLFYEDTELPGIYSVHSAGETAHHFVVNVDTAESDLTPAGFRRIAEYARRLHRSGPHPDRTYRGGQAGIQRRC